MDIATLGLQIRSDGVVVARDRLRDFGNEARNAESAGDKYGKNMIAMAKRLGAAFGAFLSIRTFQTVTDGMIDFRSRIDLAVGSTERGAQVMRRLGQMAQDTYSDLGTTVEGWLSNQRALRDLGMTTQQTLDYTAALNDAMVVSGAKAEHAARVQDALSKAMGAGELRGENLNAVIERGGAVAEALADHMGVTVSQLR